jgi:hypothetical protein
MLFLLWNNPNQKQLVARQMLDEVHHSSLRNTTQSCHHWRTFG